MTRTDRTYEFEEEVCEALKKNSTIRLLVRSSAHFESRHPGPIKEWAAAGAQKISRALLKQTGDEDAAFDIQVLMIELLDTKTRVLFCFDLFLKECDEAAKLRISNTSQMPTYYMYIKGPRYLERVKDPMPYFNDLENTSVYINGIRQESRDTTEARTENSSALVVEDEEKEKDSGGA
ncbi:unnamed protein product [Clonostachys chloroleuca]|uniref:Uncharacterized protein n=1 Tax=Clonostachys chloroleuca TaxID=1926264 RepID=A0AA35QDA2_9HYPO|nr:unnamed protein product [Clonostachys chloroleuca]